MVGFSYIPATVSWQPCIDPRTAVVFFDSKYIPLPVPNSSSNRPINFKKLGGQYRYRSRRSKWNYSINSLSFQDTLKHLIMLETEWKKKQEILIEITIYLKTIGRGNAENIQLTSIVWSIATENFNLKGWQLSINTL